MPEDYLYPKLSSIIKVQDLPEQLGFIKEGLNQLFDNFYYREFQYTKGENGHNSFDNVLLCPRKLGIGIPGTGFSLILNPAHSGNGDVYNTEFCYKIITPRSGILIKPNGNALGNIKPIDYFRPERAI